MEFEHLHEAQYPFSLEYFSKPLTGALAGIDIWVMLAATALLVLVSWSDYKITRREGFVLLACYVAYLSLRLALFL